MDEDLIEFKYKGFGELSVFIEDRVRLSFFLFVGFIINVFKISDEEIGFICFVGIIDSRRRSVRKVLFLLVGLKSLRIFIIK